MPLLLDTHVVIWLQSNSTKLSKNTLDILLAAEVLFLSKVSIWEIAIKFKSWKLLLDQSVEVFIESFLISYRVKLLDISLKHIYQTQQLPLHHRDPFDRLLIAQAASEQIPIVSSDEWFDQYNIQRIW